MAISLDNISRKKLILIRQLFLRAKLQAENSHSNVDRIMSLIGFDLATETALKTVVSVLSSKMLKARSFPEIITEVNQKLRDAGISDLSDEGHIRWVHDLRNDAQHKAKYPSENELAECRIYTRDFLQKTVKQVWDQEFESISLIDGIEDEKVRQLLQKADDHLSEKDYTGAVAACKAAFEWAVGWVKESIFPEPITWHGADLHEPVASDLLNLREDISDVRNLLLLRSMGVDITVYRKYERMTQGLHINRFGSSEYRITQTRGDLTEDEATFVLEFVTETALQAEWM